MKAVEFDYRRPASLAETTCALLAECGSEAEIIAGGQTLVPLLVMRLARPALRSAARRASRHEFLVDMLWICDTEHLKQRIRAHMRRDSV